MLHIKRQKGKTSWERAGSVSLKTIYHRKASQRKVRYPILRQCWCANHMISLSNEEDKAFREVAEVLKEVPEETLGRPGGCGGGDGGGCVCGCVVVVVFFFVVVFVIFVLSPGGIWITCFCSHCEDLLLCLIFGCDLCADRVQMWWLKYWFWWCFDFFDSFACFECLH